MKKILVPCDFSDTAKEAFKFAVNIAEKNKSEIHVLYVVDSSFVSNATSELSHVATFNGVFIQRLEEQFNEKFTKMKGEYASDDMHITFKLDIGSLTQSIQTYIPEKKIDLVIMGTHGASGLKEFFIGSNTEKIVRYANVPVVAVPLGSQFDSIQDIILPVDPNHRATNFIHEVKAIQNFFQAKVQLLWINTPHIFKSDAEAMEDLQEFAEDHHFHDYKLNVRSDHSEQEGILHFAREIKAGLIFMPTHSRKGLVHWLTGSITENVVNHVQCPVWTYSLKE
jgi:nucleotide-binding universal stress UspA family protein